MIENSSNFNKAMINVNISEVRDRILSNSQEKNYGGILHNINNLF